MKPTTALKAIRLKCLDCCCGSSAEVRRCHIDKCALHGYRFGHKPKKTPEKTGVSEA